jgi:hypothetical protein
VVQRLHQDEAELAGMRRLYLQVDRGDRYIQAARGAITRYLAALGVDWQFFPLLLVSTWTERVIYSQRRAQKLGTTGSRAATKFTNYVGLLASHTDELFENTAFWRQAAQQPMANEAQVDERGQISEVAP